jgi:hypothetical protein
LASVKVTELGGTQEVWKKICRSWISISACIMAWFENKTGLETQTALAGAGRLHIYLGKSGIAGLVGAACGLGRYDREYLARQNLVGKKIGWTLCWSCGI